MDEGTLIQPSETIAIDGFSNLSHSENKPIDEFLINNIKHILQALVDLQDLDAFEVFIKVPGKKNPERLFPAGQLDDIWCEDAYTDTNILLRKYFLD